MGSGRQEYGPDAVDRVSGAWAPDLARWGKPHYQAIVESLAEDIRTGRLRAGTRLPTQRALAARIGLNFTTVSRGYVEAHRRCL
ncbi:MAG: GntR family transcriptional regulator, partial [Methylobacteriaceae bacterium]